MTFSVRIESFPRITTHELVTRANPVTVSYEKIKEGKIWNMSAFEPSY